MGASGQERGDATRKAIEAAARTLFLRQGYHGTTMRQIAGAAGIVPGAVYNHFGSKEELYLALLRDANIYAAIGEALRDAGGQTVEQVLRNAAHRLVSALAQHSDSISLVFLDVLEFDGRNVAALIADALPLVGAFFVQVASLGERTAELKPIRVDVLARAFLGLFVSYSITARFLRSASSRLPGLDADANLVDSFLDIFAYGALRAPKGE